MNGSIQRYDMVTRSRGCESWDEIQLHPDGDYVRFEDIAPILASHERLRMTLTDCLDTFEGEAEYLNGCSTRDMVKKIRAALKSGKKETVPEWRMLGAGELIQEGDEFHPSLSEPWESVVFSVGKIVGKIYVGYFRRPVVTAANFQPVIDFHQRECGGGEK